ncbi:hypothetical protein GGI24_004123 [Coemansia furcata]|nr:hypothetical protein GGI24_004123 [Coemansia furcata]
MHHIVTLRTQALLLRTDTEAQLCSQILLTVCLVDGGRRAPNSEAFGYGESHHTDHELIRSRLGEAFVETVWALGVQWEPDSADGSDDQWRDERLQHAEKYRALLQMTKALIASGVIGQDLAKERLDADFWSSLERFHRQGCLPESASV